MGNFRESDRKERQFSAEPRAFREGAEAAAEYWIARQFSPFFKD